MVKICPYCKCIFLPNGKCRNEKCVLGQQGIASIAQIELIYSLCSELGIETKGRDPNKLSKEKASQLIKTLIARKVLRQVEEDYESEEDE